MKKDMSVYDVVMKLIGPIDPVGESHTDDKRYSNLENLIDLVDSLLGDIREVGVHEDCHEYSMAKAGEKSNSFLYDLRDSID